MRAPHVWAVAVRAPGGGIEVTSEPVEPWMARSRLLRLPLIRGVAGLADSLRIGLRALATSARIRLRDEQRDDSQAEEAVDAEAAFGPAGALLGVVVVAVVFPLPAAGALMAQPLLGPLWLFLAVETLIRVGILLGYLTLIGRSRGMRRTFAYHGAEHMAIACREAGDPLTPDAVDRHSRLHPRCGTSFLLTVVLLTSLVLAPLGVPDWHWLLLSRLAAIPVVVAVSYEALKWLGRHRASRLGRALAAPGLMLQHLTTREPDRDQLEVAIAALERVLAEELGPSGGDREAELVA